ncbi:MAG: hypothetical protein R3F54_22695 [Alphaproteobacteria bacterium]
MSTVLMKILGVVLLVSTVGLASCQAMWTSALTLPFPGLWN